MCFFEALLCHSGTNVVALYDLLLKDFPIILTLVFRNSLFQPLSATFNFSCCPFKTSHFLNPLHSDWSDLWRADLPTFYDLVLRLTCDSLTFSAMLM